jgi:hypothetical protein
VNLAARGSRQITDEVEKIEEEDELRQVRGQARTVNIKSAIAATLLTLLALIVPPLP